MSLQSAGYLWVHILVSNRFHTFIAAAGRCQGGDDLCCGSAKFVWVLFVCVFSSWAVGEMLTARPESSLEF